MKVPSFRFGRTTVSAPQLALGIAVHLFVPLLFVFIAWRLDRWAGTSLRWPAAVRVPLGAALVLLAAILEGASLPQFFRLGGSPSPMQPTERLVVSGPYRYCRHPIYIAYGGYVLGIGIAVGSLAVFPVTVVFLLMLACFAKCWEEPMLRRRYGEEFDAYRRRTPFFLPRPRRRL